MCVKKKSCLYSYWPGKMMVLGGFSCTRWPTSFGLTETLDEMVQNGTLTPELAIQVLVQFDKSMTEALETQVKSKVSIKGHLHTYRFCDNVWTFILQDALFKSEELQETVGRVKIVACDSKLLSQ